MVHQSKMHLLSCNNDPEDPTMAMETVVPDVLVISERPLLLQSTRSDTTWHAKDEQKAIILYMNELDKSEIDS